MDPPVLHSPLHDHSPTSSRRGKECVDRPSTWSVGLARRPAVEAAASILAPEPVDIGTAERADHVEGIVVVERVTVLRAASFDSRNGEVTDARAFQSWMSDGLRHCLHGCPCAFLRDHYLSLGRPAGAGAFVPLSGAALVAQKSWTTWFRPEDIDIVRSTSRGWRRRPF